MYVFNLSAFNDSVDGLIRGNLRKSEGLCGVAHATAIAVILGVAEGNFFLVDLLLTQIERMLTVIDLDELSPEAVEAVRQAPPCRPLSAAKNVPFTAATHRHVVHLNA
ncbi:hypothetical protein [Brevibacterium aurantiacum]|uniref:hypothetical protein n=1 Tax=Brevibacterium aurantiacum TaxID=273384 RepID=UPI0016427FAF|nr:hypothetical protein [Brevibacterium aurantiacum]